MGYKSTLVASLIVTATLLAPASHGQIVLTGTNYSQHFDSLDLGLPPGWTVRTNADAISPGTPVIFNPAAKSWGSAAGEFGNFASVTNNTGALAGYGDSAATQSAFTNRALGLRQTSSFGNPGAAFMLQLDNAVGLSNLVFTADLLMLRTNQASTTWTIDYAVGDAPDSFTTLGTFPDPNTFGATHVSYSLGSDADGQSESIWIRVAALASASGGGTSDSFGIDNVELSFLSPAAPLITQDPVDSTNAVHGAATFSSGVAGNPPFGYQWYKGLTPLTNGGKITGATSDTLTIAPVLHADAGAYHLLVTNASGSTTSAVATLTVVGFAFDPVPPAHVVAGETVTLDLGFIDNQTPVVDAAGVSGNPAILPDANIQASADGSTGSVSLTPLAGTSGVVLTTVTASDGDYSTEIEFPLMVVPSTNVVFNDYFEYDDGALITESKGLWLHESGTVADMAVGSGELQVSRSLNELCHAELVGGPYPGGENGQLFARFKVRFTTLPAAGGNYFAYFRDAGGSGRSGRIWASTANAEPGKFRLGIGNGSASTATSAQVDRDLELNVTYTVVTRLELATATASIWIDPASDGDNNSTVFTTGTDVPGSTPDITGFAFRQAGSEGILLVDDLVISRVFDNDTAVDVPAPVALSISPAGDKVIVSWEDSSGLFKLVQGSTPDSITNTVATQSPHTNAASGGQNFFQLQYP